MTPWGSTMTRPLPLRGEQPPPDATIVVRAGVMNPGTVTRTAQRSFDLYAVLGISVEGVIETTVQEACRGERVAPYHRVRLSTFGRVRAAGFPVLASFDHPHFTLVLPDLSELIVARLARCFDAPIPNPGRPAQG